MRRLALLLAGLLTALLTLGGVASCSTSEASIDPTGATVVDVRTPQEYDAGHLEGAVNIDVSDPTAFAAGTAALDPTASYIVYCRSGNRSATAAAQMADLGFTDVTDAGGLQEAADATGLEIVTD